MSSSSSGEEDDTFLFEKNLTIDPQVSEQILHVSPQFGLFKAPLRIIVAGELNFKEKWQKSVKKISNFLNFLSQIHVSHATMYLPKEPS